MEALHADAADQQIRTHNASLADLLFQFHIDIVPVAQAAGGGNAGHQIVLEAIERQDRVQALTLPHHLQMPGKTGIQGQMIMALDHAGHQGHIAQIGELAVRRRLCQEFLAGQDPDDLIALHQNAGILHELQISAGQYPLCSECFHITSPPS